jgi:DNA polymerase-3 subunit chi
MTQVFFYHHERRAFEEVLPKLVGASLERGWRVLIRCESAERADAIDNLLWTFDEASFLPHAQQGDGDPALQPVLITVEEGNANGANALFLIGGAAPPDWSQQIDLTRIALMFDGRDPRMLGAARASWKDAEAAGHEVKYYSDAASGKFELQA